MRQRIISAILMIIICVPFLILGGVYFKIFASILAEMCLYELLKYKKNIPISLKIISYLFLGFLLLGREKIGISLEHCILLFILTYLFTLVFVNDSKSYNYNDAFFLIGIIVFFGISFQSIIEIRMQNLYKILYLLCISIITDSFALFFGKSIGKHKLAPSISPNKTIEGFIGGSFMGTVVATTFYRIAIGNTIDIILVILLTFLLSVIGQLGDLTKSSIKRTLEIKDFSNLIPGHGGVLDRLDSLIFISLSYLLLSRFF